MAPPGRGSRRPAAPEPVTVRLPITLSQFLKVARLVSSGGEAKILVAEGEVRVNGQVDTRRGRKLAAGDVVQVHGAASARVVTDPASPAESPGGLNAAGSPGSHESRPVSR